MGAYYHAYAGILKHKQSREYHANDSEVLRIRPCGRPGRDYRNGLANERGASKRVEANEDGSLTR
jgi:hypothetical protein